MIFASFAIDIIFSAPFSFVVATTIEEANLDFFSRSKCKDNKVCLSSTFFKTFSGNRELPTLACVTITIFISYHFDGFNKSVLLIFILSIFANTSLLILLCKDTILSFN